MSIPTRDTVTRATYVMYIATNITCNRSEQSSLKFSKLPVEKSYYNCINISRYLYLDDDRERERFFLKIISNKLIARARARVCVVFFVLLIRVDDD